MFSVEFHGDADAQKWRWMRVTRFMMCLAVAVTAVAAMPAQSEFYVRSDATGSGVGSDWANAFPSLPSNLERGATYYVADGTYSKYTFDDPLSGTKYITIRKATDGSHGTDVGWLGSYGDGTADFTCSGCTAFSTLLWFKQGYYILDGVSGGGPNSWTTGHGFKLSSTDDVTFITISNSSAAISDIELRHLDIGSTSPPVAGVGRAIYMGPTGVSKSNITISDNYIHDIGDSMHPWYGHVSNVVYEHNYVTRNASSPASHGAGMEFGDCSDIHIRYNMFVDITGTGVIGIYNPSADYVTDNLLIYGNIFYDTPSFVPPDAWNGVVYCVS